MIDLSTGEFPGPPENGNDILLDINILLDRDEIIWMQYVVSDPDPSVGGGTRETMGVTLTSINKGGGVWT